MSLTSLADEEVIRTSSDLNLTRLRDAVNRHLLPVATRLTLAANVTDALRDNLVPLAAETPTQRTPASQALGKVCSNRSNNPLHRSFVRHIGYSRNVSLHCGKSAVLVFRRPDAGFVRSDLRRQADKRWTACIICFGVGLALVENGCLSDCIPGVGAGGSGNTVFQWRERQDCSRLRGGARFNILDPAATLLPTTMIPSACMGHGLAGHGSKHTGRRPVAGVRVSFGAQLRRPRPSARSIRTPLRSSLRYVVRSSPSANSGVWR